MGRDERGDGTEDANAPASDDDDDMWLYSDGEVGGNEDVNDE